jgi:hypothetical protein
MEFKWLNNQELFPGVNVSLMKDIIDLSTGHKITSLKWSKQFNVEYVGELAERWMDRNVVQDMKDLRALILGISLCGTSHFLYDQEKRFVLNVAEYLKVNWDVISAAAILKFGSRMLADVRELQEVRDRLVESECTYEFESDRILLIALANEAYIISSHDELRKFILRQVDGLKLNIADPHRDYPLLLLLSEVYYDLKKPTAKELQTKGMSRLLQIIGAMRNKEVGESQDYHHILNVSVKDLYTLNFLLAVENTPRNHSITGPGFQRIKENYFESHFVSDADLPLEVEKRVRDMDKGFFKFLLNRIESHDGSCNFRNKDNLKRILHLNDEFLMECARPSYLTLLQQEVLDGSKKKQVIEYLLRCYDFTKEKFDYLENLRLQEMIEFSPSQKYTKMCLEYGYASLENIVDLEKRGMIGNVIEILQKKQSYGELLTVLEQVTNDYHKFLLKDFAFNKLKALVNDNLKKRLYPIYLNVLYSFEANKYPGIVFDLLNNEEFQLLFELSDEELGRIEKKLFVDDLLPEKTARSIRKKYMTPEQLEELKINELCEKLEGASCYALPTLAKEHMPTLTENAKFRVAFINQMLATKASDQYDVQRFLLLFFQLRAKGLFTLEEIEQLESKAMKVASAIKIA